MGDVGGEAEMFSLSKKIGSSGRQGSTFLWVEEYGQTPTGPRAWLGALRTAALAAVAVLLAHGAAFFIGWERFH